jgi:hypothetical protein
MNLFGENKIHIVDSAAKGEKMASDEGNNSKEKEGTSTDENSAAS